MAALETQEMKFSNIREKPSVIFILLQVFFALGRKLKLAATNCWTKPLRGNFSILRKGSFLLCWDFWRRFRDSQSILKKFANPCQNRLYFIGISRCFQIYLASSKIPKNHTSEYFLHSITDQVNPRLNHGFVQPILSAMLEVCLLVFHALDSHCW